MVHAKAHKLSDVPLLRYLLPFKLYLLSHERVGKQDKMEMDADACASFFHLEDTQTGERTMLRAHENCDAICVCSIHGREFTTKHAALQQGAQRLQPASRGRCRHGNL